MFMGKDEIKNTIALTKIKCRSSLSVMLRTTLFIGLGLLAIMIPYVINVLKYKSLVSDIFIYDYSLFIFWGRIAMVIFAAIRYKQSNEVYTIFPQTASSRFLSTQLIIYLWLGLQSILSLVIYMIYFLIFRLLSEFRSNIILAFRTDLGFILMGTFIFFLYGILAAALISLIAALIRKFGTIAIGCFMIIIAIIITSEDGIIETVSKMLSFLTKESSIGIFLLKALITWLLLFISAFFINKYTSYFKARRKYSNSIVTALGVAALIVISIIRASQPEYHSPVISQGVYSNSFSSRIWQDKVLNISVTENDNPGQIPVKVNFDIEEDNMHMQQSYFPLSAGADTIEIRYRLPVRTFNNYNLTEYTNPKFTAKLEDNVLEINYNYNKNIKVVFLSPWFVMRQFEKYQDKDLYFLASDFNYSNSRGNGYVNVFTK